MESSVVERQATDEEVKRPCVLKNWERVFDYGYDRLHGNVYGHPVMPEGELIFTSKLIWIQDNLAQCLSRIYQLDKPKVSL